MCSKQGTQPVKWSEADVFISSTWTVDGEMIYGTVRMVCFINVWHCVWICGFHMSQPGVCCHGNVSSFLFMNMASEVSQGHTPPAGPHLRQRVMSPLFTHTFPHATTIGATVPHGSHVVIIISWWLKMILQLMYDVLMNVQCTYRETDGPVVI